MLIPFRRSCTSPPDHPEWLVKILSAGDVNLYFRFSPAILPSIILCPESNMTPDNARVFIIEDNPDIRDIEREILEKEGHVVVGEADNFEDALAAVDEFKNLRVQVATTDGNLSGGEYDGSEGRAIIQKIKRRAPGVKTLGLSNDEMPDADIDLRKKKIFDLGKVVTDL